jgi:streptogramin lyase
MKFFNSCVFFLICIMSPAVVRSQVIHAWATPPYPGNPKSMVFDAAGNLYCASDPGGIIKVTPSAVATYVGTIYTSNYIVGTAIDVSGNLYIATSGFVSKITASGDLTQQWAEFTDIDLPNITLSGIVVDATGNVYVSDAFNSIILKINASNGVPQVWATLPAGCYPAALTIDASGNVYTANNNSTVCKVTAAGVVTPVWATLAYNSVPFNIKAAASGNIYTSNQDNTISKITPSGTLTTAWAQTGSAGQSYAVSIVIDAAENVYVANHGTNSVQKISSAGVLTTTWALAGTAFPSDIALDPAGNIYTVNFNNNTISKIANTVPLPLELLSFKAIAQDGIIALKWITSGEINTSSFNIQRSFDGVGFETIGTVKAHGKENNNYTFSDDVNGMKATTVYYRLQMADLNDESTYSKIEKITLAQSYRNYSIYPNPLMGNHFTIDAGNNYLPAGYKLYNLSGKVIQQGTLITKQTSINAASLSSGSYLIKLTNGQEMKIIKP